MNLPSEIIFLSVLVDGIIWEICSLNRRWFVKKLIIIILYFLICFTILFFFVQVFLEKITSLLGSLKTGPDFGWIGQLFLFCMNRLNSLKFFFVEIYFFSLSQLRHVLLFHFSCSNFYFRNRVTFLVIFSSLIW